ncbi:MAG: hypothetical protein HOV76_12435 [Hamadaea sp.]|nr:hypothetical protein [Hamadaea sp.]
MKFAALIVLQLVAVVVSLYIANSVNGWTLPMQILAGAFAVTIGLTVWFWMRAARNG